MSVHRLSAAAALSGVAALATPAAAHTLDSGPYVSGFTVDRLWAGVAALLAIGCVILGVRLLARSARRTAAATRKPALLSLGLAVFAIVNGVLVVLTSDAGPGSGNGIVGGYIAVIVGIAAAILSGLALTRSRRVQSS